MTPDRIKQCLQIIKRYEPLSQRGLAAIINYDERQVRRWISDSDHNTVPDDVAEWLETTTAFYQSAAMLKYAAIIEAFYAKNPPPVRTRRKSMG